MKKINIFNVLYFIGFLITVVAFILAIISAIYDKELYNKTINNEISDTEAIEKSLIIRDFNSTSIIMTCIGFLFIHIGHIIHIRYFSNSF